MRQTLILGCVLVLGLSLGLRAQEISTLNVGGNYVTPTGGTAARTLADYTASPSIGSGPAATFRAGNMSGTSPWLTALLEQSAGDIASALGIYTHNTSVYFGVSSEMSAANDPTNANADSPRQTFLVYAKNTGSIAPANGILGISQCIVGSTYCTNNLIALGGGTAGAKKLVGLEIDQQFGVGDSASNGSGGLFLNTFNVNGSGPALQLGAINGAWSNGLGIGGLLSTGAGLYSLSGQTMNSLVDCTSGTYTTACAILGNNQIIRFAGTAANPSEIKMDASNNLDLINTASGKFQLTDGGTNYAFVAGPPGVNFIQANANSAGNNPNLSAVGGDTNVKLDLIGKGTLGVRLLTAAGATVLADFEPTTFSLNDISNVTTAQTGTLCWSSTGGNVTYDNTNTCLVSSLRFKHAVRHWDAWVHLLSPRSWAISQIMRMRPIGFEYKSGSPHHRYGLAAEELATINPDLVDYKDGKPLAVYYFDLGLEVLQAAKEIQYQVIALWSIVGGLICAVIDLYRRNRCLIKRIEKAK